MAMVTAWLARPAPRAGMMVSAFMAIESNNLRSLLEFLAVGSAFGTVFAALAFCASGIQLTHNRSPRRGYGHRRGLKRPCRLA
jgi:hypothetical protein